MYEIRYFDPYGDPIPFFTQYDYNRKIIIPIEGI